MRYIRLAAVFAGLFFPGLVPERLLAQTATQTVTFSVMPTSRTIVSGTARLINVRKTTSGRVPTSVSDGGASYAITTNESNQKISASLDAPMPHGVVLAVSLAAPVGATSVGPTALGIASADVVTGISGVNATALPIVHTLSASANARVSSHRRVVTYTITAGP